MKLRKIVTIERGGGGGEKKKLNYEMTTKAHLIEIHNKQT